MPKGQPFTALCRNAAIGPTHGRADLHLHTTFSDGLYTPAQIVDLARRSGLAAIALTDHDTLGGVSQAQQAARGSNLEVIPGVEISAEFEGREVHLLGLFCRPDDPSLNPVLNVLGFQRTLRFQTMADRLRGFGIDLAESDLPVARATETLGRRHLAQALVKARHAGSIREAFSRYLGDNGRVVVAKIGLPIVQAIALVRGAGGVAAWAHPSYHCNEESLRGFKEAGLGAIEVAYPAHKASRERELRTLAARFELAVCGGSDCHGPEPAGRAVGACSISRAELDALRKLCSS
jgi:predicted metal-dependent phosphoesterase TrpH